MSLRRILIPRYSTELYARRSLPENGLLSYRSSEKEEIDNRPNFIYRAQVAENHPQKLLEFVYTVFPDVKRTQAKQWLQYNSLLVNDEPQTKFDLALRIGDWISVKAGKSKGNSRSNSGGDIKKKSYGVLPYGLKIVYEDEAIFIVDKPHALSVSSSQQSNVSPTPSTHKDSKLNPNNSTNGTDRKDKKFTNRKDSNIVSNTKTVHSIVSSYLGKRAGSSESKVFIVNRLDEDESGLVIFAKSSLYKEYLVKNWNSFGVIYNVLCMGMLFPQQGTVSTYMDESESTVLCSLSKSNSSKSSSLAISHYRTLQSVSSPASPLFHQKGINLSGKRTDSTGINDPGSYSLLEISLETTRRDQLRSQFSFINHSICGDYKYGLLSISKMENKMENKIETKIENERETKMDRLILNGESENDSSIVSIAKTIPENRIENITSNKDEIDNVSIYDPIRRLGVHFSEIRMTHPISKDTIAIVSEYPSSFLDPIKRSKDMSSLSLFESQDSLLTENKGSAGNYKNRENKSTSSGSGGSSSMDRPNNDEVDINSEIDNDDGQLDSLQTGLEKHKSDNNKNDKIKVFTLTEFLGTGPSQVKSPGRNGPKRNNVASSPPDNSNKIFVKKARK